MTTKDQANVTAKIGLVKGRPMLSWIGKQALSRVNAFPAQLAETYHANGAPTGSEDERWEDWPAQYPQGGLLFYGDNKEVLANLLTSDFRGKVNLIYIDPPFDSAADYVRQVQLRGAASDAALEGESLSLGEQIQYTDIWANDNYLQFMYERLILLKELLTDDGSIWLHCDWHKSHQLRCLMDEVFGQGSLQYEVIWQRTDPHNDAKGRVGRIHDTLLWYSKSEKVTYNWQEVAEPLSDAALKEYSLIELENGDRVAYTPELEGQGRRFKLDDCTWKGNDPNRRFTWRGARPSNKRVWPYDLEVMEAALERGELFLRNPEKGAARCRVSYLDEREGQILQSIWTAVGRMKGGVEYPTEKPRALLSRIIQGFSNPSHLVLDCFIGSGTTAVAAQELGRRWIGCDINKGAIQTTSKRLQKIMNDQVKAAGQATQNGFDDAEEEPPAPAQTSFSVYRVNDYDLAIQHNEAANLACEHIGIDRTKTDGFFDGVLGTGSKQELVRIVPFDHPLGVMDLEEVRRELEARGGEETRGILLVCVGKELQADHWLEDWNKHRGIVKLDEQSCPVEFANKIRIIELRTDQQYGKFFVHQPAQADVKVDRADGKIRVEIEDFISPTIVERLGMDTGNTSLFKASITDWRAMVDSVMIDPSYDGEALDVAVYDVPESKNDLVRGTYELPEPDSVVPATVAVKITDMLGEEVLITAELAAKE